MEARTPLMTGCTQTRKEGTGMMGNLFGPKKMLRVGTWNVRTLWESGKTAQAVREMNRYRLNIMGMSEVRWQGSGRCRVADGVEIIYSCRDDGRHEGGVALAVDKEAQKSLLSWVPVNDRLIYARFNTRYIKLSIIQCYAPTNQADEEDKDSFYEALEKVMEEIPRHDMIYIIGDMNAKVGSSNDGHERSMGNHGVGRRNENGEKLLEFCDTHGMCIGGTIFPHRKIHKTTWLSPDGKTENQIDHCIIQGKWRRSLMDVRVMRGADIGSDHQLLLSIVKIKLNRTRPSKAMERRICVNNLNDPQLLHEYKIKVQNRFTVLQDQWNRGEGLDIEEMSSGITSTLTEVGKGVLGFKRQQNKEWLSTDTWNAVARRRLVKAKLISVKSERLKSRLSRQYAEANKEVKDSARRDKRAYLDNLADEAEQAAGRGDLATLYKITRTLSNRQMHPSQAIRDKEGKLITAEKEQLERWTEHFKEILNRASPQRDDDIPTEDPPQTALQIDTAGITIEEVEKAIKGLNSGKAPGIDNLNAELLKGALPYSAKMLQSLLNKIWEEEKVPITWKKGLIVKLPKKGDRTKCGNWRGITLLSTVCKVMGRIILGRMQKAIDTKIRREQAGFRKNRGCRDQIFVLRNIIEQCYEWNSCLYLTFVDFEKAFDSIYRQKMWDILEAYGVPNKIRSIIKDLYEDNQCSVVCDGKLSPWFEVKSGVRQGCMLSPMLFLITLDWVMNRVTQEERSGIQWTLTERLEELAFADDICLMAQSQSQMQRKLQRLERYARAVGLKINIAKTENMRVNANNHRMIRCDGQPLREVDNFTYLGAKVTCSGGREEDIQQRIQKSKVAFNSLAAIWRSRKYKTETKLRIFNSNVKSVLLYGAETWVINKKAGQKLQSFIYSCHKKIFRIFWPQRISRVELQARSNQRNILLDIKIRRWNWLGHISRMEANQLPRMALY